LKAFINPHAEKQEHIINAALNVFSRNGYRKASMADIAEEAGIAKGMINYYFGSKKNLYLYLAELCGKNMAEEMRNGFDPMVTDFFDNMKMMTGIKIALIREHPAILTFLTSLYLEKAPEVKDNIQEFMAEGLRLREQFMYQDVDISRFEDDVDPKLIDKLLVWAAEGLTNNLRQGLDIEKIEAFTKELYACLDLMKKYFYK